MPLLEMNVAPSTKELRLFAGLWWPILGGFCGAVLLRKFYMPAAAVGVWVVAGILAITGLLAPRKIRPLYMFLMYVTYPIGFTVSYVLLLVVYFLICTPIGLLARLFHDPMGRQFDRLAASYWTPHQQAPQDRYFRQF